MLKGGIAMTRTLRCLVGIGMMAGTLGMIGGGNYVASDGGTSGNQTSGSGTGVTPKKLYLIAAPGTFQIGDRWKVPETEPDTLCSLGLIYGVQNKRFLVLTDQLPRDSEYIIIRHVQTVNAPHMCLNIPTYECLEFAPPSISGRKRRGGFLPELGG